MLSESDVESDDVDIVVDCVRVGVLCLCLILLNTCLMNSEMRLARVILPFESSIYGDNLKNLLKKSF